MFEAQLVECSFSLSINLSVNLCSSHDASGINNTEISVNKRFNTFVLVGKIAFRLR